MRTLFVLATLATSSLALAAVCPTTDADVLVAGDLVASGSTVGATNDYQASCGLGSGGAGDYQVEFVAPNAGTYVFDTFGSSYDTTISAWDIGCGTDSAIDELACNDDSSGTQSSIELVLDAGDAIVINIDGYNTNEGDFVLNVTEVAPPVCTATADLGSDQGPALAFETNCGSVNDFGATCGGSGAGEELLYTWTAPADGSYVFSTVGSDHDTVLNLVDGACGELSGPAYPTCNDDGTSGFAQGYSTRSVLTVDATAGEVFNIGLHGYNAACGDAVLNILDASIADADADGIEDAADVCLGHDLLGDDDVDGFCNDEDECLGDDATGDNDFDDICDSDDFSLSQTDIIPGQPMTFTAINAAPGSTVFFMVSPNLEFANPLCHPVFTDICTNLSRPNVLGTVTADAAGTAELTLTVPNVPAGFLIYSEAAYFGGGTGDTTDFYGNNAQ